MSLQQFNPDIKIITHKRMSTQRLQLRAKIPIRTKFRDLIDTLRTRTNLKEHIAPSHLPVQSQHSLQPQITDILPVTQINNEHVGKGDRNEEEEERLDLSEIEESISETENQSIGGKLGEAEKGLVNQITDLLRPEQRLVLPKNQGRSGCIRRQRFTLNKPHQKQPRYTKVPRLQPPLPSSDEDALIVQRTAIKDIDEIQMIKYWNNASKIDQNSSIEAISDIFSKLVEQLSISTNNPTVKKYKNCVYFGAIPSSASYEGIIYYFDNKLYYGQLSNGYKHGHGVEIDFNRAVRYAGYFENGKKNGFFFVQKERQNYEGLLLHGLYHGNGKLMTEDCIYTGAFENGKKHGFGEQFYPKTGLRLKGCFKNGEYQHLDKSKALPDPTSEAQLRSKPEKIITKCNSYDIDFQLQRTFKRQVEGFARTPKQNSLAHEDSKSLFDIVTNTSKLNKYDYIPLNNGRLPKIRIEGIQTKFKQADPEAEEAVYDSRKEIDTPIHRRYHSQQQKSFASSQAKIADLEQPLTRHRLNTPIHRLK